MRLHPIANYPLSSYTFQQSAIVLLLQWVQRLVKIHIVYYAHISVLHLART